jgi:hypothetical protein
VLFDIFNITLSIGTTSPFVILIVILKTTVSPGEYGPLSAAIFIVIALIGPEIIISIARAIAKIKDVICFRITIYYFRDLNNFALKKI